MCEKHVRYPVLINQQPGVMPKFWWLRLYCHSWATISF